jgi:hypothetical protein
MTPAPALNESLTEARKTARVTDNPKPAKVVEAAISILRAQGWPMSRKDLHTALSERGVVVNGANPVKTLGTMLWRAPDMIVQIDGQGYWPKGDALPQAGYGPLQHFDLLTPKDDEQEA